MWQGIKNLFSIFKRTPEDVQGNTGDQESSEDGKSNTETQAPRYAKLTGYDFYKSIGSPKYICAPMVD